MAVVTFQLAQASVVDLPTALLALAGLLGVFVFGLNATWLVLGAAIVGITLLR
jgi:hypothetical protein